jgi:hypothetical protein
MSLDRGVGEIRRAVPALKQRFAAIGHLVGRVVTGEVVPVNPLEPGVRGQFRR